MTSHLESGLNVPTVASPNPTVRKNGPQGGVISLRGGEPINPIFHIDQGISVLRYFSSKVFQF